MTVISNCDADDDWTGTALTNDTTDKMEGTGCLVDTIAVPVATTEYNTIYNPTGTWDWSGNNYILFWLKCDRANTAFTFARLIIYEGSNYRYWDLTFSAGEWTAFKFLLSTGDGESGTSPNFALTNKVWLNFQAADTTAFYKKIDNVWVSTLPYDTSFTMTMDMKL